jgi:hypothetical protein
MGRGSLWTREHPPVRVLQVIDGDRRTEDAVTIALMVKHGFRNVRGGSWCSLELLGMPDPIARAYARAPPKPGKERDERVIFDHEGQAVALLQSEDGWVARLTGPLAVVHGPSSGVVLLNAPTQEGARDRAVEWIAARVEGCPGSVEGVEERGSTLGGQSEDE